MISIKKKINVVHVIEKLNNEEGGLYNIVQNICKFLPTANNIVITEKIKNKQILGNFNCRIYELDTLFKKINFFLTSNIDLVHIHGIWSPINTFSALAALKKKIPYIVSPQGMLEPWSLEQGKLKKKIFLALIWKKILKKSNNLLFTSNQEFKNFLNLKLKNKNYFIIPNGCFFPKNYQSYIPKKKIKNILFLSRIHPKKGLENLINVFKDLNLKDCILNIVGSGEEKYLKFLKELSGIDFLNTKIIFHGFKDDREKIRFYKNNDLFVLPSFSENFGIVVAEALHFGLPVITTNGTPWKCIKDENCGWWISNNKNNLKNSIKTAYNLSQKEIIKKSRNAKKLSKLFNWKNISIKIEEMYLKILKDTHVENI